MVFDGNKFIFVIIIMTTKMMKIWEFLSKWQRQ